MSIEKVVLGLAVGLMGWPLLAGTALPATNGRIWEVVLDETSPFEWRWQKHSVKADLIVTNLLTKAETVAAVTRSAGEASHSIEMINPTRSADTGEGLADAVLIQYDSTNGVLSTEWARLTFLPSPITAEAGRMRFGRARAPRVVSYDSNWKFETMGAETATLVDASVETDLPGSSGYFSLAPTPGSRTVELKFDDAEPAAWSSIVYPASGFLIILN